MQNKYHGWISVIRNQGYADRFVAEHANTDGEGQIRKEFTSPALAVDYFDKRAGEPVKLVETPLGAYRVYTEVQPSIALDGPTDAYKRAMEANQLRTECQRLIGEVRDQIEGDRKREAKGVTAFGVAPATAEALCKIAEKLAELTK